MIFPSLQPQLNHPSSNHDFIFGLSPFLSHPKKSRIDHSYFNLAQITVVVYSKTLLYTIIAIAVLENIFTADKIISTN